MLQQTKLPEISVIISVLPVNIIAFDIDSGQQEKEFPIFIFFSFSFFSFFYLVSLSPPLSFHLIPFLHISLGKMFCHSEVACFRIKWPRKCKSCITPMNPICPLYYCIYLKHTYMNPNYKKAVIKRKCMMLSHKR